MERPENERLAIVETEVKNVKDVVNRIEQKLDLSAANYVSTVEFAKLDQRLLLLEAKTTWKTVVSYATAIIGVLVATISLYAYFVK